MTSCVADVPAVEVKHTLCSCGLFITLTAGITMKFVKCQTGDMHSAGTMYLQPCLYYSFFNLLILGEDFTKTRFGFFCFL